MPPDRRSGSEASSLYLGAGLICPLRLEGELRHWRVVAQVKVLDFECVWLERSRHRSSDSVWLGCGIRVKSATAHVRDSDRGE